MNDNYDSRQDTLDHIGRVDELLNKCIVELTERAMVHDASKLRSPEKEIFDKLLKNVTYGSEEYKLEMKVALEHHYKYNRHHPEHNVDGIRGMNIIDIVEMLCDWKAATDGDITKSIEQNQKRFGYSDDLKQIFLNSIEILK